MRRTRNAKIVATLGPAHGSEDTVCQLFLVGTHVFRLNFGHSSADDYRVRFANLRAIVVLAIRKAAFSDFPGQ